MYFCPKRGVSVKTEKQAELSRATLYFSIQQTSRLKYPRPKPVRFIKSTKLNPKEEFWFFGIKKLGTKKVGSKKEIFKSKILLGSKIAFGAKWVKSV